MALAIHGADQSKTGFDQPHVFFHLFVSRDAAHYLSPKQLYLLRK